MSAPILANYEEPRTAFRMLLADECQKRILMFRGDGDMGKTTLLGTCLNEIPDDVLFVPFDFKGNVSVDEIFYQVGERVGWQHLPNFTNQIAAMRGISSVQVQRNWLTGSHNQINIALESKNANAQREKRVALTSAWFADLHILSHKLLFVIDTYDKAGSDIRGWIAGQFLTRLARNAKMRVLLAGREVPDPNNIVWGHCCQVHDLYGVEKAEHWVPVFEASNRLISVADTLSFLTGICLSLKGNPGKIMKIIETLPRIEDAL